jgi:type IV fimbrial biogenesis protein FimT
MYTRTKMAGFTIIELMITLVVAAILLAVAAPSFQDIIQNNRLTTEINTLSASLNLTRSEAITRGGSATLCKSNDSVNCVAAANWHDGWIVFEDTNENGNTDPGETIIRVVNALTAGTTLVSSVGDSITFGPEGFSAAGSTGTGTLTLCDDRDETSARALNINAAGRASLAIDSNSNGIVEDQNSNDVVCP